MCIACIRTGEHTPLCICMTTSYVYVCETCDMGGLRDVVIKCAQSLRVFARGSMNERTPLDFVHPSCHALCPRLTPFLTPIPIPSHLDACEDTLVDLTGRSTHPTTLKRTLGLAHAPRRDSIQIQSPSLGLLCLTIVPLYSSQRSHGDSRTTT